MKTTFKTVMLHAVVLSCLAACAVKKNDNNSKNQTKAVAKADTCVGGQPGLIEVQGAVATTGAKGAAVLDGRLKITPRAGFDISGELGHLTENAQAKVGPASDKINMLDVATDRNFVNLGCGFLGAATEGLTEIKLSQARDISYTKANRIFICGKVELPAALTTLSANEIFMQNAEVTLAASRPGALVIQTNNLGVKGHNSIEVKGLESIVGNPDVAGNLSLVVVKAITGGDGDLEIINSGGSCMQETLVDPSEKGETDAEKLEAKPTEKSSVEVQKNQTSQTYTTSSDGDKAVAP